MFFLGVGVAIVGATARAVGLSPSAIGYLVAAQNVGFGLAVVAGGALSDIYRKPLILAVGLVLLGASFAVLYQTTVFYINLAAMLLMGIGMGSAEAVTDAWLLDMHTRNESRLVTINHFFVSVGSVTITVYLMVLELRWETALLQIAAVLAALAILSSLLKSGGASVPPSGERRFRGLFGDAGIVLLFVAGMGAIGLGVGSAGIITTFATELRGIGEAPAQVMLALFLGGLAAGRIIVGALDRGRRPARTAAIFAMIALVLSIAFYLVRLPSWTLPVLATAMGLAIAPLLPLTIAQAGVRHREIAGTAMGIVKLSIPVGGIVIPGLVGLLSDTVSFSFALYLFPFSAAAFVAATVAGDRMARTKRAPSSGA